MGRVLIFGDSITRGKSDPTKGWVFLLQEFYYGKIGEEIDINPIYNLGIDGSTSATLLERNEVETRARLWQDNATLLVCIGVNDSAFDRTKHENWVPLEDFRNNMVSSIDKVRGLVDEIIVVGPTPVDDELTDPAIFDNNLVYKLSSVCEYADALKEIAASHGLKYIDVISEFMKEDIKSMFDEGVHPSEKGHELIFRIVKRALEEKGII